ncbi:MAG: glycosyltransferase family 9 protein [Nanoarchaeota archaeon]
MKILVIKLGAKGDVVRTLSILPALKNKYPQSHITWITKEGASEVFKNNPYVDKVLSLSEADSLKEEFDILYCLDIEEEASDIALNVKAKNKKGFYTEDDYPRAFNAGAEYYLNTFFDDELKKKNKITAQEMMFMASDLEYNREFCPIFLTDEEKKYGESYIKIKGINKNKLIGLHLGASSRWPSRFWPEDFILDFVKKANQKGLEVILFGSPRKEKLLNSLLESCKTEGLRAHGNNVRNTDREFLSLVNTCNIMITSDSFAMHSSLALKKPTVTLFFCTSPDEIEGYGLQKKVISPLLYDFFPEKMDQYSEELVKSIRVEEVIQEINLV